ncbi:hypothetical protein BC829DRAFT_416535 [Chytridium lagenaria]|nr:hypothetical protein BC829DRAFT_416535 [Chytridium lagenaria]
MVKSYLDFLQREGQSSLLTPVQATPVFPEKLTVALSHWSTIAHQARQTRAAPGSFRYTRLVALQNIAFCLLTSEAGYRGSDIDRLDPNAITGFLMAMEFTSPCTPAKLSKPAWSNELSFAPPPPLLLALLTLYQRFATALTLYTASASASAISGSSRLMVSQRQWLQAIGVLLLPRHVTPN